ncbi:MAG: mechanosensitive ion channel family protein [Kiritimatiellae bacterium]|nr:mechanosensitive ion channel family protein [Kiritimatiellia bacterium]
MNAISADWTRFFDPAAAASAAAVALATYFLGRAGGKVARRVARRLSGSDPSIENLAGKAVAWGVWTLGALAALAAAGIDTRGVMTALGGLALAVGLGLRDTLSNAAAGLSLLVLRPLAAGEFVTFSGDPSRGSGTVVKVGLFETELRTVEGVLLSVPNRVLLQEPIANFGRNKERLVRLTFPISYSDRIDDGLRVLLALGASEPRRIPDKPAEAFVEALGESSVDLSLRVWTKTADYWPARRALVKACKEALEKEGLTIPFPQRDVHVKDHVRA